MMYPDYNKSVVNLLGSLSEALGAEPIYEPLAGLDTAYLAEKDVIIMMNIDALGMELLEDMGEGTILGENIKFELTSLFPSTTAVATVAYQTGMAAFNHGLTGWFVHLKEIGATSAILPFCPRYMWQGYEKSGIRIEDVLESGSIFDKFKRQSYCITSHKLINTPVTQYLTGKAQSVAYKDLKGFCRGIVKTARRKKPKKKFIYAYWSQLDHIEHRAGPDGAKTREHFGELCQAIEGIKQKLEKVNYILLISTDHGMLKVSRDKVLKGEDYPELQAMLNLPFAGEPRVPYCYVKPEKAKEFEAYVQENLSEYCELLSREEIIARGWYGRGKENSRFRDRIGDYVLVMKDNYVFKDKVLGGSEVEFLGYHGGLSAAEMRIPLIIIEK